MKNKNMTINDENIPDKDKEALIHFLKGKKTWNEYVKSHSEKVDFYEVNFSNYLRFFDFDGYTFPSGGIDFTLARFSKDDDSKDDDSKDDDSKDDDSKDDDFGDKAVYFSNVDFGDGEVLFAGTSFGDKGVSFSGANFGAGGVSFSGANFGAGGVSFSGANFGAGGVDFSGANFGGRDVDFENVNFGDRSVSFGKATFGKDEGKCRLSFKKSIFGEGGVSFKNAQFYADKVSFEYCEFKGYVSFQSMTETKTLSKFSLRHSSFDKSLDISDNTFSCIPDLTNTKLTNQVSLDRMEISDKYPLKGDFDESDGERLCRLKELAEANKSYQQALDFHVIEMRAKRYNTKLIKGKTLHRWLDTLFDIVCLYGQSIIRPVLWLIGLTIVCAWIYAYESSLDYFPFCYGLLYSVSQVFSFVPAGRSITIGILDKLFPCEPQQIPNVIYSLSLIQGVLSFLLVFLIGLGLRNRFRL
ncbi:pentapeptide repeat-containing protein [Bathymodiolus platifrons methanotrophic gill symbiont]|uniref:pentapeptide repeat-containing protein n=1 Tax=Bathymodiolus platifrons methanotrophic gill symbiont TaxID=113268 RepID=UPI001C8D53CA|nr:pentapeptide repeat-containing protein [Bathymodiolus platifrons methanotrophic gill symbiont]